METSLKRYTGGLGVADSIKEFRGKTGNKMNVNKE